MSSRPVDLLQEPRREAEKASGALRDCDIEAAALSLAGLGKQVHLWSFPLAASTASSADDFKILSTDEIARAARFQFRRHQQYIIVARATLRRVLARYLGQVSAGDPAHWCPRTRR